MMTIVESPYAEEWLYSVLANDPELKSSVIQGRVYRNYIEQTPDGGSNVQLPAVRFFEVESMDLRAVGLYRVWNSIYYQIEVIDKAESVSHLRSVANRIDSLLHGGNGVVSQARIISCHRNSTINRSSIVEIVQYQHLGGLYVVNVQAWDGNFGNFMCYVSGV